MYGRLIIALTYLHIYYLFCTSRRTNTRFRIYILYLQTYTTIFIYIFSLQIVPPRCTTARFYLFIFYYKSYSHLYNCKILFAYILLPIVHPCVQSINCCIELLCHIFTTYCTSVCTNVRFYILLQIVQPSVQLQLVTYFISRRFLSPRNEIWVK